MTFDGKPPLTLEPREEAPRPRRGRPLLIGVAAACVLGLGLGLLARPQLVTDRPKPAPMQPAARTSERQMDIMAAEPAPEPTLPPRAPLETMSPDMIAAAPEAPTPPEPPEPPETLLTPSAPEPPWAPQAPVARDPAWREPVRAPQPSFDCRQARSQAEEMVCSDPVLAAADRQMARAFQRAARSGIPYGQLRAEQDDWLAIRDDAARRSARAVASVYDQRIEELNAMADGQGPGW